MGEVCVMADETKGAKTTLEGDRGDAKAQPSRPRGDHPGTAGSGETKVRSGAAEQAEGELNPSSPGNTGTTPGSVGKVG